MRISVHIKGMPPMIYEGENFIVEHCQGRFELSDEGAKDEDEKLIMVIAKSELIAIIYETPNSIKK